VRVAIVINGQPRVLDLPPMTRLLDVLRGPLGLSGTKEGCGEGECGTCTVLLDGEPVNACLLPIAQCHGRRIETVESLASAGRLAPLQRCISERGGTQCGMCTPGVLLSAEALLRRTPNPTEAQVRQAMAGNLCRCTGYQRIVDGVLEAARERAGVEHPRRLVERGAAK